MLWLLVIAALVVQSQSFCELNGNTLNCDGESLESVVSQYTPVKDHITILTMKTCGIKKLEENSIPFPNLKTINLSCGIEELTPTAFANLQQLKAINLSNNKLKRTPNELFKNLDQLIMLDLSNNLLRNPTDRTFLHLDNLKVLNLSSNRITYFEHSIFDSLVKLEELYVRDNSLYSLITGVFSEQSLLKIIDLSNNPDLSIGDSLFEQNSKLEKILMNGDELGDVKAITFRAKPELVYLDIGYSQVSELEKGIFDSIVKLKTLILAGNTVDFPEGIFDKLVNLEHLDISDMNLTSIHSSILSKNLNLKTINLSRNKLNIFGEGFLTISGIISINLSKNQLNQIPSLSKLTSIKHIDLSHNNISTIRSDAFKLSTLEFLSMKGNEVNKFESSIFGNVMMDLKTIDVRDNRLVSVESSFFDSVPNLLRFEFVGNPWDCKCLDELLLALKRKRIGYDGDGYFDGEKRVCVVKSDYKCSVDGNTLDKYYEDFNGVNRNN